MIQDDEKSISAAETHAGKGLLDLLSRRNHVRRPERPEGDKSSSLFEESQLLFFLLRSGMLGRFQRTKAKEALW